MRKKLLCLVFATVLLGTALTGCGNSKETGGDADGTEASGTTGNIQETEVIEVVEDATMMENEDGSLTVETDTGDQIDIDADAEATENEDGSKTYTTDDGTEVTVNTDGSATVITEETVPADTQNPSNNGTTEPTHTHSYSASVTKEPTCTETGVKTYTCSCGSSYTKDIDKIPHTAGDWETTKEATCKAEGTRVKKCTGCGTQMESETIAKTDHTSGDWVVTKEATCLESGSKHTTCTVCGVETAVESIPKSDSHTFAWDTNGNTRTHTCTGCGTTGITEYNYNGAWGYFDDAAAEELWNLVNQERNKTWVGIVDDWGNPAGGTYVASLNKNDSLYSKAKNRAIEAAINFDHGSEEHECLAWGYGSAIDAMSGWQVSSSHMMAITDPAYTIGGIACFYYDSDNSGTNLTPIWVLELGF